MISLVILTLSVNSLASTQISQMRQLKQAYDQLNFSLQVEWDQKDQKYYEESLGKFQAKIQGLQDQGMTNEQLFEFVRSNIKDKKMALDIHEMFNSLNESAMTNDEAREFLMEYASENYSTGASWTGGAVVAGGILAALIVGLYQVRVYAGESCREQYRNCTQNCYVCPPTPSFIEFLSGK